MEKRTGRPTPRQLLARALADLTEALIATGKAGNVSAIALAFKLHEALALEHWQLVSDSVALGERLSADLVDAQAYGDDHRPTQARLDLLNDILAALLEDGTGA